MHWGDFLGSLSHSRLDYDTCIYFAQCCTVGLTSFTTLTAYKTLVSLTQQLNSYPDYGLRPSVFKILTDPLIVECMIPLAQFGHVSEHSLGKENNSQNREAGHVHVNKVLVPKTETVKILSLVLFGC